jgi:hypothetical protein
VTNIRQVWILTTYGNDALVHYPLNVTQIKKITTVFFIYEDETCCVPTTCVQSCLIQMSHSKVTVVETCDHNNHANTCQVYPKYDLYLNQYDNNSLGSLYTVFHVCQHLRNTPAMETGLNSSKFDSCRIHTHLGDHSAGKHLIHHLRL